MSNLPTIPEYMHDRVDSHIDLTKVSNIPCPFHHEVDGKSFTWSAALGKWRCWGKCHCGGDVYDLHRLHMHLPDRDSAVKSLNSLYSVENVVKTAVERPEAQEEIVELQVAYNRALRRAITIEDWLELDYIMSCYPPDVNLLKTYCEKRR